jgi:hypothetical protein
MKTSFLFGMAAILAITLNSCSNSSDNDASTDLVISSGNWRVTLFTDSGNDETADFNGYVFTFHESGTISAVKGTSSKSGSWSTNSSSHKFNIDLGPKLDTNKPLGELTDDWLILSTSNTMIELRDDNVSSQEFLTFTKN